jgi:hypothetical protein
MECPHCLSRISDNFYCLYLRDRSEAGDKHTNRFSLLYRVCSQCGRHIIFANLLNRLEVTEIESYDVSHGEEHAEFAPIDSSILLFPKDQKKQAKNLSPDIDESYREDYQEAYALVDLSPKASAALSRRCLQRLLHEKANVNTGELNTEIQKVLELNQLPAYLAKAIDAIRNVGNFAAHPLKSTRTNEIMDVEPGEAQWLLDVLENLFDFYFVQPAELARKRDALNKKLQEAKKPRMR